MGGIIEHRKKIADRRDERIGVHHLNRIDAARVAADHIGSGKWQLPVARFPPCLCGIRRQNVTLVFQAIIGYAGILIGRSVETADRDHRIGRDWIGRIAKVARRVGRGGRANVIGIEQ